MVEIDERDQDKLMPVDTYKDTILCVQRYGAASCIPFYAQSFAGGPRDGAIGAASVVLLVAI